MGVYCRLGGRPPGIADIMGAMVSARSGGMESTEARRAVDLPGFATMRREIEDESMGVGAGVWMWQGSRVGDKMHVSKGKTLGPLCGGKRFVSSVESIKHWIVGGLSLRNSPPTL